VVGSIAAAIAIFLIIAGGMWAVTGDLGESAVLGAFCAVWGGPGFGVIGGGVLRILQQEAAPRPG
jgi:hypothetical protein